MADLPKSEIRSYEPRDLKELRLLMGQSAMEKLAIANRQAYLHPFVIAIWLALASILVQVMHWWPRKDVGFLGYLAPIPGYAAMGFPVMFAIDWYHRPRFEKDVRRRLSEEDILDIPSYYSSARSLYTRFSVLVWKDRPIGYVAVDTASPDETLNNLEDEETLPSSEPSTRAPDASNQNRRTEALESFRARMRQRSSDASKNSKRNNPNSSLPMPSYAVIRHFHVDRTYHNTEIQFDLIRYALKAVFVPPTVEAPPFAKGRANKETKANGQKIDTVYIHISSIEPEVEKTFRAVGFVPSSGRMIEPRAQKAEAGWLGKVITGETVRWFELTRENWERTS